MLLFDIACQIELGEEPDLPTELDLPAITPDNAAGIVLDAIPDFIAAVRNARNPIEPRRVHKTGRNEPCPCGSGKKFKKCCGR